MSEKFNDLGLEYLNTLDDKKLLETAIYSYLFEIEYMRRDHDGSLNETEVDEEYLKSFLIKTKTYIEELQQFFNRIDENY